MRLLHTSDWHLGRLFHGVHLTEDQAHLLDQFLDLVKDVRPHAVIVAGDVYDRAVPPTDAVDLLSDVLSRLVMDLKTKTVLIAGNHDSPARLGFGSKLLAGNGLHVFGMPSPGKGLVELEDDAGKVGVYALPYAEPALVRDRWTRGEAVDHQTAMAARLEDLPGKYARSVAVAHVFAAGGSASESERPLSVGGAGTVDPALFKPFSYTALGHLHRPQKAGSDRIHYSGSLMKYSFSESDDRKSVSLVEVDHQGGVNVERIPLSHQRDLRRISGFLENLLNEIPDGIVKTDYLQVELLDKGALYDPMARLREVYPNVLHIERKFMQIHDIEQTAGDHRNRSDIELFSSFFSQVAGEEMSEEEASVLRGVLDEMNKEDREAGE